MPRVLTDLPCIHCNYNLRTLDLTSLCPECGSPVEDSLHQPDLPDKKKFCHSIATACILLLVSSLLIALGTIFNRNSNYREAQYLSVGVNGLKLWLPNASRQFFGITELRVGEFDETPLIIVTVAGILLQCAALWPLTRRIAGSQPRILRIVLRSFSIFGAFAILLLLLNAYHYGDIEFWGWEGGAALLGILELPYVIALYLHLREIARQFNRGTLASLTTGTLVLILVTSGATASIWIVATMNFFHSRFLAEFFEEFWLPAYAVSGATSLLLILTFAIIALRAARGHRSFNTT